MGNGVSVAFGICEIIFRNSVDIVVIDKEDAIS